MSAQTGLTTIFCASNQLTDLDVTNQLGLSQLSIHSNNISSIDLSNNTALTSVQVYKNPISELNISEAAKPNITTLNYRSTNIESLDLTNYTSLSVTLAMTKSTNANLSQLKGLYVTGSRPYTDTSMVRVLADTGSFSWDSGTGYYIIPANCNATYGFSVASADGSFASVDSLRTLADGGLMDDEGNLIPGTTLADVLSDGTIKVPAGGVVATPNGTYTFDGEATIKDGVITTNDSYMFEKNISVYDEATDSYVADISAIRTVVDVKDGTNLASGIDQKAIDDAQAIVDRMTDSNLKTELQDKINTAQDMLDAKNAVDDLFNDKKDNLAEDVTQKAIDDAKDLVNKLPDGELKTELQKELDKAQDMLDAKNAAEDLLDKDGNLNTGITQEDIDKAQDLVNKLPDGELKDQLQTIIDDAQKQLDDQNKSNPIVKPSTPPSTSVPVQKPSIAGSSTTGNNVDTSDTTNLSLYLRMLVV